MNEKLINKIMGEIENMNISDFEDTDRMVGESVCKFREFFSNKLLEEVRNTVTDGKVNSEVVFGFAVASIEIAAMAIYCLSSEKKDEATRKEIAKTMLHVFVEQTEL